MSGAVSEEPAPALSRVGSKRSPDVGVDELRDDFRCLFLSPATLSIVFRRCHRTILAELCWLGGFGVKT
ncbi:MAG: hypothetical protein P8H61_11495, partial [Ilumatobacter sp.]|nr:hypothetical protein [Ilumatobacter sp.]